MPVSPSKGVSPVAFGRSPVVLTARTYRYASDLSVARSFVHTVRFARSLSVPKYVLRKSLKRTGAQVDLNADGRRPGRHLP